MTKALKQGLVILMLLLAAGGLVRAEADDRAAKVEVAMLYNILKFVDWPAEVISPGGDLIVGVWGESEFNRLVPILDGKPLRSGTIRVFLIDSEQSPLLNDIRVLCVRESDEARLSRLLAACRERAVLAVSDQNDFGEAGGMLTFVRSGARVGFELNLDAASLAGLIFSSKLAKLAQRVFVDGTYRSFK